ncbi:MAG TPA: CaiB/BaiF CoA-transferase family protein [Gemmatimonadales bacterium]
MEHKPGPLAGIRVLELTHAWAGPYCGMVLADMGAEVIKIESPTQASEARGGYPYVAGESVPFMMLHRNKKSLTLNLKHPRGRDIFYDLVRTADILVQNFRPGAVERLGVDYETLRAIRPELIYASLSGFGSTGPSSGLPGVNMIALAVTGLAATTMGHDRPPIPLGYALCDIVAGMWAAYGILAAYIHREQTGVGQHVDTSLLEAGVSLMFSPVAMHDHVPGYDDTGRKWTDGNAPSGFFKTADGSYVAVFASYPALWERFVAVMGMEELAADPRFATREQRTARAEELHQILGQVFLQHPTSHWVELLNGAGVPAAPVNSVGQMMAEPQIAARAMIVEQEHPRAGTIRVVGVPVKLSRTPGEVRTPAPLLGEHTDEILAELGLEPELPVLRRAGVI